MANTVVYSASAGSGKTFALVLNFLSLLLNKPRVYQNILAVTFTNKATLEMKQRIISVLQNIVSKTKDADDYIEILMQRNDVSVEVIQQNAAVALRYILHDYSNFYVETIDSFFQRVLRNLGREIGISTSFNLVIEQGDYTRKAVKELIKEAEHNRQLRTWLNELMEERIERGERWNYEKVLTNFSEKNLSQYVVRENLNEESLTMERLTASIKRLKAEVNEFVGKVNESGSELLRRCGELGLEADNFKGKSRGIYSKFAKLVSYNSGSNDDLTMADAENDIGLWLNKPDRGTNTEDIIRSQLMPLYKQVNETFSQGYKTFISKSAVLSRIYQTGLLKYILDKRAALLRDDNAFLLNDTPVLLSQMVESTDDVSFIYEKIGGSLKHVMIDEFQDTALADWRNFSLILRESLANGNDCFVFGDVKQAIYRWRNGDWKILNDLIENSTKETALLYPKTEYLTDNWRTDMNIVEFNNRLFAQAYQPIMPSVAQNLKQKPKKQNGEVRACFLKTPKDEDKSAFMLAKLKEELDRQLNKGYKLSDIVILCRNNDSITLIAQYLNDVSTPQMAYNPSSDEAFALSSNQSVLAIVYSLQYLDDLTNTIALSWLLNWRNEDIEQWLDKDYLQSIRINKDKPLLELLFDIANYLNIDMKSAFVAAFFDFALAFVSKSGSDVRNFLSFWETDLRNKRVMAQEGCNSLKITSIHKAKGLEYPVVIVPYCHWRLFRSGDIWVHNTDTKISDIGLFSASLTLLEKSTFLKEYDDEVLLQQTDNFNLLYVALTRAKHSLVMIAQMPKIEQPYKNVAALLYDKISQDKLFSHQDGETEEQFVLGEDQYKETERQYDDADLASLNLGYSNARMAVSEEAIRYFNGSNRRLKQGADTTSMQYGSMLHYLLSLISTKDDTEQAINLLSSHYNLADEDISKLEHTLALMFDQVEQRQWFNGKYKVLREQTILSSEQSQIAVLHRPDRIMIGQNEVIIVDFKFSASQNSVPKYEKQVREYANLLSQMGYSEIHSFLWFISDTDLSLTEVI
ncbi:MAG: UvrD-helicase domain-containing protein [Bacteroidales bacterium]|jgi:ATP-dependent exoDNAse (exonuclease V) beta subunit|nr:UvrD-helicase domain-containing protein [Bacteroidales bacterium]